MPVTANHIIQTLQREILPLQGFKQYNAARVDMGFKPLEHAFPNNTFPTGAIHEFMGATTEDIAATSGFIAGLLSRLMQQGSPCLWIGAMSVFPCALPFFNVQPDKIIFLKIKQQKNILWAMEEALKCDRLAAVVGEISNLDLTQSRRLQLAVEQSSVTGLVIRQNKQFLTNTACIARWRITSMPSGLEEGLPGVGFPRWNVELLKVRNGKPGTWQVEWSCNGFQPVSGKVVSIPEQQICNTG